MANKKPYIHKLRSKYRLIIYNDQTYAEVWYMRLSRLNVMSIVGILGLLLVGIVVSLIAFTPLREFIPGYPDRQTHREIVTNALRLDSLEQQVQQWVLYNDNISRILSGKEPLNIEGESDTTLARRYRSIVMTRSAEDSLFRKQVEEMEQFNLTVSSAPDKPQDFASLHFFPPVRGKVIEKFSPRSGNFGVAISTQTNSTVVTALEGTVIAAFWTLDMGYVVQVQHGLGLTTTYKKLGQSIKKVGAHLEVGEVVGMIGAVKSKTKTPILVFEIWHNGTPVNPEQHIIF
ncbi:MAG: M23 family metallopeptidase [Prevotellaceae bacterium]|jgi:murein DD-endopeptidase MepM/ murein hydrolase activator NlpD|nr:M23 family metallopeptidase [Prevotellaceae bacterium]